MNTYEITYHSCSSTGRRVGALRYHTITADSAISARFAFEDRFGCGRRSVQIVELVEKPVVASAGRRTPKQTARCPKTTDSLVNAFLAEVSHHGDRVA